MSLTIEQKEIIDEWVGLLMSKGELEIDGLCQSLSDPWGYVAGALEGFILGKTGDDSYLDLVAVQKHIKGEN